MISAGKTILDGLCDPQRWRRSTALFACAYAAAWTLYGVIAKSSQDLNADMAEMVVWSRQLAFGYPKHPPFPALVIKLWFTVFPVADWAFILLATATVAAGIYLATELGALWLDGAKRAATPFLLGIVPFYNFFALKFDQNSVLIPLWALAMWALLRSLAANGAWWAALAGAAAAAAMLTKYWSFFLLAAMTAVVLFDTRRAGYWRSKAPWITIGVFAVLVVPHALWLIENDFPPLHWVGARRSAHSIADFLGSLSEYCFGTLGYASLAILLVAFLIHPPVGALRDSWFSLEPRRRPATLLFWTPLLLPIAVALVTRTDLLSLWNEPALNLLPVMMLASPLVTVPANALKRLVAIVTAFTLASVAVSPLLAFAILKRGVENDAAYAQLAAAAAEQEWHQTTSAPLRLVAGPFALSSSAAFYIKDGPSTFADFSPYLSPWLDANRLARDGIVIICPASDPICLDQMNKLIAAGPPGHRRELTLTRHWLGFSGAPKDFVVATVPPRG